MTANHEHTPTTEQVRDGYSRKPPGHAVLKSRERQAAEFDGWLAERDARIEAAAEQRGEKRALVELSEHLMKREFPAGHHPGLNTALHVIAHRLIEITSNTSEPDRADQEGDID